MKLCAIALLLAAVVFVESGHTFMGTNVLKHLVYHRDVRYPARVFQKRIEYVNYTLPGYPSAHADSIVGILAYDLTHSGASVNVTQGGIGSNFVNLRFKSDRAKELHYELFIYT